MKISEIKTVAGMKIGESESSDDFTVRPVQSKTIVLMVNKVARLTPRAMFGIADLIRRFQDKVKAQTSKIVDGSVYVVVLAKEESDMGDFVRIATQPAIKIKAGTDEIANEAFADLERAINDYQDFLFTESRILVSKINDVLREQSPGEKSNAMVRVE